MRFATRATAALLAALVVLIAAAPARSQQLHGEVVHADSVTPARAAIVYVIDSSGAVVARTLTTTRGSFVVELPREGLYRVRVLRIGFQPTESPPTLVGARPGAALRLVLLGAPVVLARVTIRGERECRIRADSAHELFQLWEEARKVLSAAQLALASGRLESDWLRYRRRTSATDETLYEDSIGTGSGRTARPFVSAPPAELARLGYRRVMNGQTYFGPDGETLLSEDFAGTHCFRLRPPTAEHPGWIGAEFEPARERNGIVDIEGTAWLDRASAELQVIEYRYTNVPREVIRAGIGGRIEYARLASGEFVLNRWYIRIPGAQETQRRVRDYGLFERAEVQRVVTYLSVSGGELRGVRVGGEEGYRQAAGSLDVRLSTASSVLHAAGATVAFEGTPYLAVADSTGVAHLDRVARGTYTVGITTPEMRELVIRPLRRQLTAPDAGGNFAGALTFTDDDVLAAACGEGAVRRRETVAFGIALDSDGTPWADDTIQVRWTRDIVPDSGPAGFVRWSKQRVTTDEFGRWSLCGLPRMVTVAAGATTDTPGTERMRRRVDASESLVRLRVTIVPRPAARPS